MQAKDILAIASRLFGLYLIIKAVILVPSTLSVIFFQDYAEMRVQLITAYIITLLVYAVLAYYLLKRADKVIAILTRNEEHIDNVNLHVSFLPLAQTAFIIVGTYIVIDIFPHLLENIYRWIKLEITKEYEYEFNFSDSNLFYSIVRITLGFLIATNSRNLALWIEGKKGSGSVSNQIAEH